MKKIAWPVLQKKGVDKIMFLTQTENDQMSVMSRGAHDRRTSSFDDSDALDVVLDSMRYPKISHTVCKLNLVCTEVCLIVCIVSRFMPLIVVVD